MNHLNMQEVVNYNTPEREKFRNIIVDDINAIVEEISDRQTFYDKAASITTRFVEQYDNFFVKNNVNKYRKIILVMVFEGTQYEDNFIKYKVTLNRLVNKYFFDKLSSELQDDIEESQISKENFLRDIDSTFVDRFTDLFADAEKYGELMIFDRDIFPAWDEVEVAFKGKGPIVDINLGCIFSIPGGQIHEELMELLYLYKHKNEMGILNLEKSELRNLFLLTQGYYKSSASENWCVTDRLLEQHPELITELGDVVYNEDYF